MLFIFLTQETLCAAVRQLLLEVCQRSNLDVTDRMSSLSLDSLGMVRLSAAIARKFKVEVPVNILFSLETLGDLERVVLCGPKVLRNVLAKKNMLDFRAEVRIAHAALLEDVMSHGTKKEMGKRDLRCVLLTGASGFLGAFIASKLAELGWEVLCLVRGISQDEAHQRFSKCLKFYRLSMPGCANVTVLPSSGVERVKLGLAEEDFSFVMEKVSFIVHCAALVSGLRPYADLSDINVIGTKEVIALAYQSGAKLIHISTMGFVPDGHKEVREIPVDSLILRSGYAQSKWVAEELLWQAMEKPGIDAIVVRPGNICGHSESGASNPKDALSMLLIGRGKLKLPANVEAPKKRGNEQNVRIFILLPRVGIGVVLYRSDNVSC